MQVKFSYNGTEVHPYSARYEHPVGSTSDGRPIKFDTGCSAKNYTRLLELVVRDLNSDRTKGLPPTAEKPLQDITAVFDEGIPGKFREWAERDITLLKEGKVVISPNGLVVFQ